MTPTILTLIFTLVFSLLIAGVIVSYRILRTVDTHLANKRDVYRDMDVLLTKVVVALDRTLDRQFTKPIEINEKTLGEVGDLKATVQELLFLSDDVKDLKGRVAVQSVGKAFSPRRKG